MGEQICCRSRAPIGAEQDLVRHKRLPQRLPRLASDSLASAVYYLSSWSLWIRVNSSEESDGVRSPPNRSWSPASPRDPCEARPRCKAAAPPAVLWGRPARWGGRGGEGPTCSPVFHTRTFAAGARRRRGSVLLGWRVARVVLVAREARVELRLRPQLRRHDGRTTGRLWRLQGGAH